MRTLRRVAVVFLAVVVLTTGSGFAASPAQAQVFYPPVICAAEFEEITVPETLTNIPILGGLIGQAIGILNLLIIIGCEALEFDLELAGLPVDFFLESERVFLGRTTIDENGQATARLAIPANTPPGQHTLIARVEGVGEFTQPVTIPARGSVPRGGNIPLGTTSGGNIPLGTTTGATDGEGSAITGDAGGALVAGAGANAASLASPLGAGGGGGGGARLPATGASIVSLLIWAFALIGLGTLLLRVARGKGLSFAPAFAGGGPSARRGILGPPTKWVSAVRRRLPQIGRGDHWRESAPPDPGIPFVDTSHYEPTLVPTSPKQVDTETDRSPPSTPDV